METVSGIGGGGNTPARIVFSGKAFPGATLGVWLMGEEYGRVLIDGEFKTQNDGSFKKEITAPVQETRFYGLFIKDREGNPAKSKFFTYNLKYNTVVHQEKLIFAPTVKINKTALVRNELLLISGYAAPGNTVEALANGKAAGKIKAEDDGSYRILVNTDGLVLGGYKIQTRQVDFASGKTSDVSEIRNLKISSFSFALIDFNEDDKIGVQDWSIFLSNWSSQDEKLKVKNDLNGDGKIDISDFSIFLMSFQLGNR